MNFGSNDAASFHLLHKVFTKGLDLLSRPRAQCGNTHRKELGTQDTSDCPGRNGVRRTPLTVQEVARAEDRKDTISRRGRQNGATSNECHVSDKEVCARVEERPRHRSTVTGTT